MWESKKVKLSHSGLGFNIYFYLFHNLKETCRSGYNFSNKGKAGLNNNDASSLSSGYKNISSYRWEVVGEDNDCRKV